MTTTTRTMYCTIGNPWAAVQWQHAGRPHEPRTVALAFTVTHYDMRAVGRYTIEDDYWSMQLVMCGDYCTVREEG